MSVATGSWRAAFALGLLFAAAPAASQIATDGSVGPAVRLDGPDAQIPASLGTQVGGNLFHSFSEFGVREGEAATFTRDGATQNVENLVARVRCCTRSDIMGRLSSTVGERHFFFLNPAGVVFGPSSVVEVPGSFHVSTADALQLEDGTVFSARGGADPVLTAAPPAAFGFTAPNPASLSLAGEVSVARGATLDIVGGPIDIGGGPLDIGSAFLWAPAGQIRLAAVGGPGTVSGLLGAGPLAVDASALAPVSIRHESTVSVSGLEVPFGATVPLLDLFPEYSDPPFAFESIYKSAGLIVPLADLREGDVIVGKNSSETYFAVVRDVGAGEIFVRANSLELRDSDLRARSFGSEAGRIDVRLDGPLVIDKDSSAEDVGVLARAESLITTTGRFGHGLLYRGTVVRIPGCDDPVCRIPISATGAGSEIVLRAGSLTLRDGARVTATSLTSARGGSIDVDVGDLVHLIGHDNDALKTPTAIFSNAQGGGDAGDISVKAQTIRLEDGGEIVAQTETNGNAGDISVDVGRLEILGTSQIDTSTGPLSPSEPDTTGNGGDIHIRTGDSILIAGRADGRNFARLSTFAGERTTGNAGTIDVHTPLLEITDGGGIATTTRGAGDGGDLRLDVGELRLSRGGSLAVNSTATSAQLAGALPGAAGSIAVGIAGGSYATKEVWLSGAQISAFAEEGPASDEAREGNIAIAADDLVVLRDGSSVTASVARGLGGDIAIANADVLALEGGSTILAETQNGTGGAISLATGQIVPQLASAGSSALQSADFVSGVSGGRISADAGAGTSGTITTSSPENEVERQVSALDLSFLETQGIQSACAARASGEIGSFQVARYRGLPSSPEDLLLAFDDFGAGDSALAQSKPDAAGAGDVAAAPPSAASEAIAAGALAMRSGKAEAAERHFADALTALGEGGNGALKSDALRGMGEAQQAQGHFGEARETLDRALAQARASGDAAREAAALSHLGETQVAMRDPAAAETAMRGFDAAQQSGDSGLASRLENDLGNEAAAKQQWQQALGRYEAAAARAHAAGRGEDEATALASAARAALETGEFERAAALIERAERVEAPRSGAAAVHRDLHLGQSLAQLANAAPDSTALPRRASLQRAFAHLRAAESGAEALGDARLRSFALGDLGALYESEQRRDEALYLTRQALAAAETAQAPDALYRWHWQEGRILWSQGQAQAAIASIGRAVEIVEATRQVSLTHYGSAALRFQRAVAPLYRDYVEVLLRGADRVSDPRASRRLLEEARATMEQYQAAELRDYFRDACVADIEARTVDLDRVLRESSPRTAVVYPISLADRLELLVSLPGGLERFAVPVSAPALDAEVARLRSALVQRVGRGYEPSAEQLYRWLVAPYRARLADAGIETLVFVPGGALRTIPLGALYDGEHFLLEQYAVAVTPGLSLVDPHALKTRSERFLLAGLSQGGEFAGKKFDSLPKVGEEIGAIHRLYGGDVLLDAGFDASDFRRAVVEEQPTIVHVASHAYFGGESDESFLLTHDGAVTFDELGAVVGPRRYTEAPLELLVLSACRTAAGDERAALGLAGVAIRSGARSAVGSLWSIPDEDAYQVMTGFYEALSQPRMSKAKALQHAQLAILNQGGSHRHPFYWSPYLLISNWL
ncbi:MAG: CHAT domain-containing protein [Deltaproteobacteria bacterium]|nr:MAG: CHAT domain-containing protein [Deltaproteobacteria bacterium]